jgi:hypothetical protein
MQDVWLVLEPTTAASPIFDYMWVINDRWDIVYGNGGNAPDLCDGNITSTPIPWADGEMTRDMIRGLLSDRFWDISSSFASFDISSILDIIVDNDYYWWTHILHNILLDWSLYINGLIYNNNIWLCNNESLVWYWWTQFDVASKCSMSYLQSIAKIKEYQYITESNIDDTLTIWSSIWVSTNTNIWNLNIPWMNTFIESILLAK